MLAVGLSCPSGTGERPPQPSGGDAALTMFFTGNELGSLKPCGCSGGQLGGLEKRAAIFNSVPASNRLLVETGSLVGSDSEQDLIKFRILFEALKHLNYDVVHLTDRDLEIAGPLGLPADPPQGFRMIRTAERRPSEVFTKRFTCRGREIAVRIAAFDPETSPVEQAAGLFVATSGLSTLDVLILERGDPGVVKALATQMPGIDCIICPSDSDEPHLLSDPGVRPLVFTIGRFGRYVCRLDAAVGAQTGELALRFEPIPIETKLPDDDTLVQLYKQYQQLVKESNLLEKHPRMPLPGDLAFAGSNSCKRCHEPEYQKWSTQPHAHALASLKKVGSEYDPECVACHVVGMEYERGFITEARTPQLKDVGCENCHGPGSEHIRTFGQTATSQPKMTCLNCHTPERSGGYTGHEQEYMQKIVHWREPAAAGNVKN